MRKPRRPPQAARERTGQDAPPMTLGDTHSRFGQALHRLLECWTAGAQEAAPAVVARLVPAPGDQPAVLAHRRQAEACGGRASVAQALAGARMAV